MLSIQLLVIVLLANSNSSISWLTTAKTSNSRCSNQWAIQQDRKLFLTTRVMTKTLLQLSSNGRYRDSVTDSVINTCNSYQIKESLHTLFMVPPAISSKSFGSKGKNEQYYCDACGAEHVKWMGRCPLCKEWNSVKEFRAAKDFSSLLDPRTARATIKQVVNNKGKGEMPMAGGNSNPWLRNGGTNSSIVRMDSIDINLASARIKLFSSELDRVMGGGLVKGSVVLLAGEPGIGKSTILLQLAASIAQQESVVYISGEENAEQVVSRATRLGLPSDNLYLLCETDTEIITENILSMDRLPELLIVDSIQTMYTSLAGISTSTSSAGSVTQIRESTARFVQLAKATGIAVLLVGHVTKSGEVAGPRVLEHMVDTVLYLEGSEKADYRMIRSMKNRFGSVAEVGVFTMTEAGLQDVLNPSELFMSNEAMTDGLEGSAVSVVLEGTRPLLAEIQCLVSGNTFSRSGKKGNDGSSEGDAVIRVNPKRAADGFPLQRLLLICAVIEKRLGFSLYTRDVYLNVVGGLRVFEPSADLAVAVTIVSSLTGKIVAASTAFIGELGLGGELRAGRRMEARISEAAKLGFKRIIIPNAAGISNTDKLSKSAKIQIINCSTLKEAIKYGLVEEK